ncbi:unnamed protein product [Arabidopsis thaliana]|jgi:hypothetical protein|uniref:At5g56880 n=1 Tax=Arabidopsis thaliana TaxID=3702 RepID=Q9LV38_ARATH|nr:uncharacterized protein AT5G56880 [Arabidopsis thaliana]ACI31301.1 At5g56880 [Arabidopsis thaliana]AED96818.1 hypothetical protein AT5G56880 [Arabidopsis thaliana]BAA97207.1 unnamed protein product [Arabidopsis thaliana]|eukprot:NP_200499.1 hypothetical protein AT5G56880 [Arabidopsis thaliana]
MEEMRNKVDENGKNTTAKEVTKKTTMLVAGEYDEYTPDEIMSLVESSSPTMTTTEIEGTNFSGEGSFRVRFIDDPYAMPVVVQSSSGYITINVNEESCGPSFSDSDSSVMASVDASGLFGCCFEYGNEKGGAWSTNEVRASEYEWNDDMLARFLGEDCV